MANISAKDVAALRKASGAGMMDAKKALVENDGDSEAAATWLREQGLAKAASRGDRENSQGVVSVAVAEGGAAIVELRCETDFVAKSDNFKAAADGLAAVVAANGEEALESKATEIEDLRLALKENIEVGTVVYFDVPEHNLVDYYVHVQNERGVNAVLVQLDGGSTDLAHDIALHVASSRPKYLTRAEVPADIVAAERETLENLSRNEGKPEQALPKIVEGRLTGFFKQNTLLEQNFVKDEKTTIEQLLGPAEIVRFAQVEIGA
ncbi:MAG: translation elongation factor Ts [Acidimicrobiales bacterium]